MVLWERSPAVRRPPNLRTGLRECWTLEKPLSATSSTAISRPTPFLNNSASQPNDETEKVDPNVVERQTLADVLSECRLLIEVVATVATA